MERPRILAMFNDPRFDSMAYLEPFVGMGRVLQRVANKRSYTTSDANPLVVRLLTAIQAGEALPQISRERYAQLWAATDEVSLERACAAFQYSFNGREFDLYVSTYTRHNGTVDDIPDSRASTTPTSPTAPALRAPCSPTATTVRTRPRTASCTATRLTRVPHITSATPPSTTYERRCTPGQSTTSCLSPSTPRRCSSACRCSAATRSQLQTCSTTTRMGAYANAHAKS